jgi:hypothetical protein
MTVTSHDIGLESLDALAEVDSLCLFVAEDERPLRGTSGFADWRMCGGLSRVLAQGFFVGSANDWLLFPAKGRLPVQRIFVAGLGKSKQVSEAAVRSTLASAAQTFAKAKVAGVAFELPGAGSLDEASRVAALTTSFLPAFQGRHLAVLADKGLARLLPGR